MVEPSLNDECLLAALLCGGRSSLLFLVRSSATCIDEGTPERTTCIHSDASTLSQRKIWARCLWVALCRDSRTAVCTRQRGGRRPRRASLQCNDAALKQEYKQVLYHLHATSSCILSKCDCCLLWCGHQPLSPTGLTSMAASANI